MAQKDEIKIPIVWIIGGLVAWIFGVVLMMTQVAPRLPRLMSFNIKIFGSTLPPVLLFAEALPHALSGFICGVVLSAMTGHRKFYIVTAAAAPNLLTLIQVIDDYKYEYNKYRRDIPISSLYSMLQWEMMVLLVLPAALWAGAALADRLKGRCQ